VGNEAAMEMEMLVEATGEVLKPQPIPQKANPGLEHECLLARAHELNVAKLVLRHNAPT
jgi:hypothetical protein